MRNVFIIVLVFWLLFLNGISTISNVFKNNTALNNAPQVIVNGANKILKTPVPVPVPAPITAVTHPVQIIPQSMPVLPTATPTPGAIQATYQEVTPTQESFWSPEDQAAFTATAEAWYTNVPTPPAEFVEYANKACAEATVKSPLCP